MDVTFTCMLSVVCWHCCQMNVQYEPFCDYFCMIFWLYQITSGIATGLLGTTSCPIPEVTSSLRVRPEVVLTGQVCPGKAIKVGRESRVTLYFIFILKYISYIVNISTFFSVQLTKTF